MVGGLVEQQQRRLGDEGLREQHTAPPSARQRGDARRRRPATAWSARSRCAARCSSRRALRARAAAGRARAIAASRRIVRDSRGRVVVVAHEIAQTRQGRPRRLRTPSASAASSSASASCASRATRVDPARATRRRRRAPARRTAPSAAWTCLRHCGRARRCARPPQSHRLTLVEQRKMAEREADFVEGNHAACDSWSRTSGMTRVP